MPRAEDDTSLRGQPYGAEAREAEFVEATGGASTAASPIKQIQIPVNFDKPTTEPPVPPEEEGPEPDVIDGLGDVNEFLFGSTQRPDESPFTLPAAAAPERQGVPDEWTQLLFNPNISSTTRAWIEFLIRSKILGG